MSGDVFGKKKHPPKHRDSYFPPNGPDIDAKVWMELGNDLDYALMVSITFNPALTPCPTTPGPPPPDNNYYLKTSKFIRDHTNVKTVGINWNPCGHPDFKFWGAGHFDVHMYFFDEPEYKWTCGKFPDNLFCLPNNPLAAPFFAHVEHNMPKDFAPDAAGVANMGLHNFVPPKVLAKDWAIPAIIIGSYAGEVNFFEMMFPKKTFDDSVKNVQMLTYQNQTNYELPSVYEIAADSKTMTAVVTFKGQVNVKCPKLKLETCVIAKKCKVSENGKKCENKW